MALSAVKIQWVSVSKVQSAIFLSCIFASNSKLLADYNNPCHRCAFVF